MGKYTGIAIAAGIVVLILLTSSTVNASSMYAVTDWLIPELEGFRATPYWDVSRYSWGYGTPAPADGTGTITKAQALVDMRKHVAQDRAVLQPLITRDLTPNQWGALLSFAYNEGDGNRNTGAIALVNDVNAGDNDVLETHWKKYVYADGQVSDTLVDRRNREWEVWMS